MISIWKLKKSRIDCMVYELYVDESINFLKRINHINERWLM